LQIQIVWLGCMIVGQQLAVGVDRLMAPKEEEKEKVVEI
jgi:hypothetical protein